MPTPHIADTRPKVLDMEPGTYSFCTCGFSTTQPFCNGSHIGKGFVPETVVVEAAKKIAFCMCKHSKSGYACDGSHRQLPA